VSRSKENYREDGVAYWCSREESVRVVQFCTVRLASVLEEGKDKKGMSVH
jgi:hypothetical protein